MSYQPGEELESLMKFSLELVQAVWDARRKIDDSYDDTSEIDPLEVMRLVVASVDDIEGISGNTRSRLENNWRGA